MLTAVWTVLGIVKIIGFVLLGIIGLLLVMILLVLLVPIRYQARINYEKTVEGNAGLSWLFHILSVRVVYQKKLTVWVRIFGFRVFRMGKTLGKNSEEEKKEEEEKLPKTEEENIEKPKTVTEMITGESKAGEEAKAESGPKAEEETKAEPEPKAETEAESGTSEKESKEKQRKTKKNKGFSFRKIYDKLKEKLRRFLEFLAGIKEKKEKLKAFVNDPANRYTYRLLKRQLWKLCKHIFPQKISGSVRFGFDDPYKTGQVLTYLSPFYGLYARDLQIIPVFEESVLEGKGKLKGRIRIGTVLLIAVRMLFDRNFRVLLKKVLRA